MKKDCPLCGLEITETEESLDYAHFIEDPNDEFYEFSGASFHKVCFQPWNKKNAFLKRFEKFIEESQRIHESNTGQKIHVDELMKELLKRQKK